MISLASQRLLIAYDISNDKARSKVVKLLDRYGVRIQKSFYEFNLSKSKALELTSGLKELVFRLQSARYHKEGQCLKVAIIPVCKNCQTTSLFFGEQPSNNEQYLVL